MYLQIPYLLACTKITLLLTNYQILMIKIKAWSFGLLLDPSQRKIDPFFNKGRYTYLDVHNSTLFIFGSPKDNN